MGMENGQQNYKQSKTEHYKETTDYKLWDKGTEDHHI